MRKWRQEVGLKRTGMKPDGQVAQAMHRVRKTENGNEDERQEVRTW